MLDFNKNPEKFIDHTILKADADDQKVMQICDEAKEYNFASVCVNSCHVSVCKQLLSGTDVNVCTVVGFPLGAMSTRAKAAETKFAVEDGADEIDMVINVGKIKSGNWDYVKKDIAAVVDAAKGAKAVKVIIETCLLTNEEKAKACEMAKDAGADFVKTSTGFSTDGAKLEDVALMRKVVGSNLGVKASGGVRTYDDAKAMVEAGASRIGTSNGIDIVK